MSLAVIGKNIRRERKAQRITIEDLAEKAGLSTNYLGAIERGEKVPSLESLVAIIDALNITADAVFCDSIQNGYRVKSSILSEKLENASPARREKIFRVIEIMLQNE